jgi:hypothetical protein
VNRKFIYRGIPDVVRRKHGTVSDRLRRQRYGKQQ